MALAAGFAVGLFAASALGAFASADLPRVCRPPLFDASVALGDGFSGRAE
jgi:hypothetical protein